MRKFGRNWRPFGASSLFATAASGFTQPLFSLDAARDLMWKDGAITSIVSGLTPIRASAATCFDKNGNITVVPTDVACIDFSIGRPALLLEASATNLVPYSVPTAANLVTAGTGTTVTNLALNALGLFPGVSVAGAGANWHRARNYNVSFTAGATYTVTVYLRAGTSGAAMISLQIGAAETTVAGTFGSMAAGTANGGIGTVSGITETVMADGVTRRVRFQFACNTTSASGYIGVGPYSAVAGQTVTYLGAQIETGSTATSFIVSGASATTRAADSLVLPLSFPATGYTVAVKGRLEGVVAGYDKIFDAGNGTNMNDAQHLYYSSADVRMYGAAYNGASFATSGGSPVNQTIPLDFSAAVSFGPGHFQSVINGNASSTLTALTYAAPVKLGIGRRAHSATETPRRLLLDKLVIWPALLTSAQKSEALA